MKRRFLPLLALVFLPILADASEATVHLKDGSTLKGQVVEQKKGALVVESAFGRVLIPVEKVARVEYADGPAPAAPAVSAPAKTSAKPAPTPECRMGTDGVNVCGYHCRMGTDGRVACADTADGTCAMNTSGRVTCTQLATVRTTGTHRNAGPTAEKKLNSDGTWTSGYNCRLGSNGRWYCSSAPDGQCRMNSDGTFSCP